MKSKLVATNRNQFENRRQFIKQCLALGLLSSGVAANRLRASPMEANLHVTPKELATKYNNYYEFSQNKEAVSHLCTPFKTFPWAVKIDGLVENPQEIKMQDIDKMEKINRLYRFRCVEGWSMVIPWSGIRLNTLLDIAKPQSSAKYVRFESVHRPSEMPGQKRDTLPWPYVEGLRLDEAMNPLVLLATGMYDEPLPKPNGGPIRLVVPWKYGFKSIKAVVKITLTDKQPATSWNTISPEEYGFYANVNPKVAHPRWSQRREVPLGELKKQRTKPFNGYENEVAYLYKGMDLKTHF